MIEGGHNSTQAVASTQVYERDENGNSNFDSVENDVSFLWTWESYHLGSQRPFSSMWLSILRVFSSWKQNFITLLLVLNDDEENKDEYKHDNGYWLY